MAARIVWLLLATLAAQSCCSLGFSVVYNEPAGRKLFGGYRISPRTCKVTGSEGICMFNYDCSLRRGVILGSCMDGFLFGTCCHLPAAAAAAIIDNNMFVAAADIEPLDPVDEDTTLHNFYQSSFHGSFTKPLRPPNSNHAPPTTTSSNDILSHPLFQVDSHPESDTILFHQNGSAVQDFSNPDEIFAPSVAVDATTPEGAEFATFSYVSGEDMLTAATKPGVQTTHAPEMKSTSVSGSSTNSVSEIIELLKPFEQGQTTQYPWFTAKTKLTSASEMAATTAATTAAMVADEVKSTTEKEFTPTYYSSRWPTNQPRPTLSFRPRPPHPYTVNMASSPNEDSINAILGMLDENSPVEIDASSKQPGKTTPTSWTQQSTPSTTLSVAGPSFSVVPANRPRPGGPAPTVIVLGPYTSDATSTTRRPIIHSSTNKIKVTQTTNKPLTTINGIITTNNFRPRPPILTTLVTKRPSTNGIKRPSTVVTKRPLTTTTEEEHVIITGWPTSAQPPETDTSLADQSNFPPVRNPSLNTSTPILHNPSTPGLIDNNQEIVFLEDDKLNDKVDVFVNKIVASLQGNFQDLEQVLYKGDNETTATSKRPVSLADDVPTTTRRPTGTRTTTRRPGSPRPKPGTGATTGTTSRPRPGASGSTRPKPGAAPTTLRPRPTRLTTKRPPTSKPLSDTASTTRRPSSSVTTRRTSVVTSPPRRTTPSTLTTLEAATTTRRPRPKPSRRPTTSADDLIETATKPQKKKTTTTTEEPTISEEEEDEEDDATTAKPVDFKRSCGVRPLMKKKGRIVGGKGATFGEWPWQVLVRESTWLGLFTKNKCGGVLITNKFVMTAAHCQPGFLANLVAVFGEYDISGELESKRSITKNVRRVIVHRHYDAATFANDLALLELDSPVQFDQHIVPICMPGDDEDFTGRMATVSGWGRLKYGGGVPHILQEVNVPIIENSVCQEMFQTAGHAKSILESFLCAGYANGQKDSCEGDSGGPLMLEREDGRWTLAGTVSHGIKCAAPYLPGVYMRTTFYKPWLKSITGVEDA